MAEDFQIAWAIYASSTLVLLAAGWWLIRTWSWSWLRNYLLLTFAAALLVPARGTVAEGPPMPVLPLFVYQTLFEETGASPEVSANLVFATGGALAIMLVAGVTGWMMSRRKSRRMTENDPF